MAFIKDYEIKGTGMIASNAYHVITNMAVSKRTSDILPPPDSSRADGLTADWHQGLHITDWKAGVSGKLEVSVYASKQARLDGKDPIAVLDSTSHYRFMLDATSPDNYTQQAYEYLLTTDFYRDAVVDY